MIDLTEIAGFQLLLDPLKNKLVYNICGSTSFQQDEIVSLQDLFPILLNKNIQYPQKVYRKYKNVSSIVFEKYKGFLDLYLIPYGLLGIEFIKSHIYYAEPTNAVYESLIQCYYGNLILLMQKHNPNTDHAHFISTKVEDVKIVDCSAGDSVFIPSGYFYTFINKGADPVVFSRYSLNQTNQVDYSILKKEKGMAFFIISKNAKVERVSNPKYRVFSQDKIVMDRQAILQSNEDSIKRFLPRNIETRAFLSLVGDLTELFSKV